MTSTDTHMRDEGELPRALRKLIELRTTTRVAADLGLSREVVLRYLAGVELQAATLERVERKLRALVDGQRDAVAGHVRAAYRGIKPDAALAVADATLAGGMRDQPKRKPSKRPRGRR